LERLAKSNKPNPKSISSNMLFCGGSVSLDPVNILLIEDNPKEAAMVRALLDSVRRFTFRLKHCDCLADGLTYLRKAKENGNSIDVVLLDLHLADSKGVETFSRVNQSTPWVAIIVMTNLDNEDIALQIVRQGAQDYLVKTEMDGNLLSRAIKYAIERKKAEDALRESQERYSLAIQGVNDGLWDWNLKSNKIYFSPRWMEMLGFKSGEISDSPDEWFNRIHEDDLENFRVGLLGHINRLNGHFQEEYRIKKRCGDYIWVLTRGFAIQDKEGKPYRMAGSLTNIDQRKQTEEQLLHDAFHDPLTNLPNRALFMDRLDNAVENAKRYRGYQFAVLFMDLDRFKVINDSMGHTYGDGLLIAVAKLLSTCLRSGDSVARLGGDEFVILLERVVDISDALIIADRIQQGLKKPFNLNGHEIVISASIGIVLNNIIYEESDEILRDADIAMYHAKTMGKDCHAVFSPSMGKRAIARMELENDLRQAFMDPVRRLKELDVVFQPIVSLESGMIEGFETLLRWTNPERGSIKPDEFIPIAEETGLIHSLGLWVLQQACKQLHIWQDEIAKVSDSLPLSITVNFSGKQFSRPEVVGQISKIIKENKINPSTLSLEITESLLIECDSGFHYVLEKIQELGVNIHVDDFGRGYSSFSYLQQFPVNTLKIDALFTQLLEVDGKNSEIVNTIVNLAKSLGMAVVAEGVETDVQLQALKDIDCTHVQGYYLSRPLKREAARELLLRNRRIYQP
jgi:diguanylate cyclase (GGDEF)-like protein/PAS domain S-box-containing protein